MRSGQRSRAAQGQDSYPGWAQMTLQEASEPSDTT